jgi:hypothetical protein
MVRCPHGASFVTAKFARLTLFKGNIFRSDGIVDALFSLKKTAADITLKRREEAEIVE